MARRVQQFMDRMELTYFERVRTLNGGAEFETREVSTGSGTFEVKVTRGPVVEKAGRMVSVIHKPNERFRQEWLYNRFMTLDAHPKSPLVGTLHAAFVVTYVKDGTSSLGGWVDIMPGAMRREDLDQLRATMDRVYAKHRQDPARFREASCKGDPEHANQFRRKPACVGGSFYGQPMLPVTEANFAFISDAYETFVASYFDLVERRRKDPFSAADLAAQDAMRLNWFEDRAFADPMTTTVTPYEVWSLATLPPVVKF